MPPPLRSIVRTLTVIFVAAGICTWSIKLLMIAAIGAVMSQVNGPMLVAAFALLPPVGVTVAAMDAVSGRSSGGIFMTPADILLPATAFVTPFLGLWIAMITSPPQANGGQVVLQLQNTPLQV
ncbi:unnamed protein product [Symbiodinium sp. CCMP2592]|nr:unnamed protein product [Symbiodinium sp. CCMP2592]